MSETITMIFKDCGTFEDLWNDEVVKTFDESRMETNWMNVEWGFRDVEMEIVKLYDVSRWNR